jgi:hypothetical protein
VHWNGKAWHRVTDVPSYLQSSQAVSATAQGAWVATSTSFATVFLNLASSGWYIVPILFPAQTNKVYSHEIWGVEVVSPSLAWAGGLTQAINGDLSGGLLLQRKDSVWKTVADPMPDMAIIGMALGPHGIVWAVGYSLGSAYRAESMRWDGKAWQKVPISVPRHSLLTAVVSASGGTWAVGAVESSTTTRMLIEHWTGSSWTRVAAPAAASSELRAVAVTSAHAAWAVGVGSGKTLILHWNGKSWS